VDQGIGGVLELLQQHVLVRIGGGNLLGLGHGTTHALGALGEDQPGAIGEEQLAPFDAHGLGHGEGQGNALGRSHEGQGDTGVATGRFDQFLARPEQPALLGVPHQGRADAALHRIGRVAPLDLGQHGGAGAIGDAVEPDQRGVADGKCVVLIPSGHGNLLQGVESTDSS
jgi:hypothetical protein